MCKDQNGSGGKSFDPALCPLLIGLSEAEAERMMATDPRITACRAALENGTTSNLEPCVSKMVAAHEKRAKRRKVA